MGRMIMGNGNEGDDDRPTTGGPLREPKRLLVKIIAIDIVLSVFLRHDIGLVDLPSV